MADLKITTSPIDRMRERARAEGFITESMGRRLPNSSQLMVSQTLYGELVELVAGDQITKIITYVGTAGATLTLVKVGIYSGTSLVASSADNKANFTTNNVNVSTSLSATYTVPTTGGYYLAILAVGTTPPTLLAANHSDAALLAALAGGSAICVTQASQTDLPGTATWSVSAAKPLWLAAG